MCAHRCISFLIYNKKNCPTEMYANDGNKKKQKKKIHRDKKVSIYLRRKLPSCFTCC